MVFLIQPSGFLLFDLPDLALWTPLARNYVFRAVKNLATLFFDYFSFIFRKLDNYQVQGILTLPENKGSENKSG